MSVQAVVGCGCLVTCDVEYRTTSQQSLKMTEHVVTGTQWRRLLLLRFLVCVEPPPEVFHPLLRLEAGGTEPGSCGVFHALLHIAVIAESSEVSSNGESGEHKGLRSLSGRPAAAS